MEVDIEHEWNNIDGEKLKNPGQAYTCIIPPVFQIEFISVKVKQSHYRPGQACNESTPGPQCGQKNSSDTIGNRTRDLPDCGTVPQPTAPLRGPFILSKRQAGEA
jgi:hypothetical protein